MKSALLWGVVGGLTFLVLAQGAMIAGQTLPFGFPGLLGLGIAVAVVVAASAYAIESRL